MKSNSFYDRLLMSRNSIRLWKENPWLGSGSGNWKILQARYGISGTEYLNMGILRFEHPHNDILFLLCETGIAGLLLWLATFLMAMKACFRLIRKDGDVKIRLLMCFIGAGLTGFLFLSVLSYPRERFFSMLLLMILFSIPFAFENRTIRVSGFLYRFFMLILLLSVTFVSYINLSRLKGEVLFKNALMHQQQGEMKAMYNDLLRCKANFLPVDETGTPLEWYLGLAAIYSRDTLLAESLFRRAVMLNPFHIQALNDLGSLLEKRLLYAEAENLYKRALAISPGNLRICVNLAISEFNAGDTLKAYNTLNAYPDHTGLSFREPFNRILYAMATAYVKSNRDTVLALFLNRQLSKNRLYLVTLHDSIGAGPLFFDKVRKAIGPE